MIKSIWILKDRKVEFGAFDAEKKVDKKVFVDLSNTRVLNAKLTVEWHSPISAMCLDVFMNNEKVLDFYCGWGECRETKSQGVAELLRSGVNNFEFDVKKCPAWHPWSATITISSWLEIEYEGEEPESGEIDWKTYAALGALGVAGGALLLGRGRK